MRPMNEVAIDLDTVGAWTEDELMNPPGKRKEFSRHLHRTNDPLARKAILDYFATNRPFIVPNPDPYGIDLIMKWGGRVVMGIEVERRLNWRGPIFPFPTIHVPVRKLRYACLGYPSFYMPTNAEMTHALVIPFSHLTAMKTVESENRFVSRGEYFVDVPLPIADTIVLDEMRDMQREGE